MSERGECQRPPTHEMLDENCVVRQQHVSLFLNRFFSPDARESAAGDAGDPDAALRTCRSALAIAPKTKSAADGAPPPQEKTEIHFQTYGSDFRADILRDRIRVTNTRLLRLTRRSRTLALGVKAEIPEAFFGLTNCPHPPGCVCIADILPSGPTDVRAQLINTTPNPLEIPAGALQVYIHFLPKHAPEPWQTLNLPAPHPTEKFFEIRTQRSLRFEPRATKYLTFEVEHFCPKKTSSALILQCRYMSFKKLLVDPTTWAPNCPPMIKLVNASQTTLRIAAGETLAKVMFTAPGISPYAASLTSTVDSLNVPRVAVSLTRIPQDKTKHQDNPFR